MISLYLIVLSSSIECDPGLPKIMEEPGKGITTEFHVAENQYGQCVPHGEWKETWNTGKVRLRTNYRYGTECGVWTYSYETGQPRMKGIYCCDPNSKLCEYGKEYGKLIVWHPDGKLAKEGYYCKDGQCGEWREWWPNGNVKSVATWQSGKLSGEIYNYYPNGQLAVHGWMNTDKKAGKWEWYDNNGKVIVEKDFDIIHK